jgi:hypothetical protein
MTLVRKVWQKLRVELAATKVPPIVRWGEYGGGVLAAKVTKVRFWSSAVPIIVNYRNRTEKFVGTGGKRTPIPAHNKNNPRRRMQPLEAISRSKRLLFTIDIMPPSKMDGAKGAALPGRAWGDASAATHT